LSENVHAESANVGLCQTLGLRVVRRPVARLNAKESGTGRCVESGIEKTLITLRPTICRRSLRLQLDVANPQRISCHKAVLRQDYHNGMFKR
jgi:hypothetical protein